MLLTRLLETRMNVREKYQCMFMRFSEIGNFFILRPLGAQCSVLSAHYLNTFFLVEGTSIFTNTAAKLQIDIIKFV